MEYAREIIHQYLARILFALLSGRISFFWEKKKENLQFFSETIWFS